MGGWHGDLRQLRRLRPPHAGLHLEIRRDRAVLRGGQVPQLSRLVGPGDGHSVQQRAHLGSVEPQLPGHGHVRGLPRSDTRAPRIKGQAAAALHQGDQRCLRRADNRHQLPRGHALGSDRVVDADDLGHVRPAARCLSAGHVGAVRQLEGRRRWHDLQPRDHPVDNLRPLDRQQHAERGVVASVDGELSERHVLPLDHAARPLDGRCPQRHRDEPKRSIGERRRGNTCPRPPRVFIQRHVHVLRVHRERVDGAGRYNRQPVDGRSAVRHVRGTPAPSAGGEVLEAVAGKTEIVREQHAVAERAERGERDRLVVRDLDRERHGKNSPRTRR